MLTLSLGWLIAVELLSTPISRLQVNQFPNLDWESALIPLGVSALMMARDRSCFLVKGRRLRLEE